MFGGGFGDDEVPTPDTRSDGSLSSDPSSASEDEGDGDDEKANQKRIETPVHATISAATSALEHTSLNDPEDTTTLETPSAASAIPSHPPLYLDTVFEYVTPVTTNDAAAKVAKKATQQDGASGENQWGAEGYEKMQGIDDVFERFVSRVENEPQQCVR